MILQPRDMGLLGGLAALGPMPADAVARAYFGGRDEAARTRLRALARAGMVRRARPAGGGPALVSMGGAGRAALGLPGRARPAPPPSPHRADVLRVLSAVLAEAPRNGVSVSELSADPEKSAFRAGPGGSRVVRPDGFLRLDPAGSPARAGSSLFLEVDRSTESLGVLARKAEGYAAFRRCGGFAARRGAHGADPARHPFRVLLVTRSAERRDGAAARLLRCAPPVLRMVWLAAIADVERDPFGPVWLTPADVRSAPAPGRAPAGPPAMRRLLG